MPEEDTWASLVDATLAGEGGVLGSCLGPHLSLLPPIFLAPAPAHIQVLIEQAAARKAAMCLI